MNVLIGGFILEANEHIPHQVTIKEVRVFEKQSCLERMRTAVDILKAQNIDVFPSLFADAGSNGIMAFDAFHAIETKMLQIVKEAIHEIDGVFLHLHGASEVESIGSGEHHLLFALRSILGPYVPVVVVCDPHGNLSKDYVEATTIIRSYRESPHTDIEQTYAFCARQLADLLKHRRCITPLYRKLPLILGGEQSVSSDEPVRSINQLLNNYEQDERILSCSWHVGYIRHDTPLAGCGIVVVPQDNRYRAYAQQVADALYDFIWERRKQFHYTGRTMQTKDALHWALLQDRLCFITDSGDNVTSGAMGANTTLLRQVLAIPNLRKRILFASIQDPAVYARLAKLAQHTKTTIHLGMDLDELSAPITLTVETKETSHQIPTKILGHFGEQGDAILVSIENTTIDLLIANTNQPYVEKEQFLSAYVSWESYDVVVVKCGYAFPQLLAAGNCVMALTEGATIQDIRQIPFKRIMRPMYPIDDM